MAGKRYIVAIGLNHKTAPVEVRERLAYSSEDTPKVLEAMRQDTCVDEIALFSTCNRVEFLLATKKASKAVEAVKDFMAEFKNTPRHTFEQALYVYHGDEAVRHIFRVAASLDSMVVGEPQILGQIKESYPVFFEELEWMAMEAKLTIRTMRKCTTPIGVERTVLFDKLK